MEATTSLHRIALAAAAIGVVHDSYHVMRGELHDLIWFCNLAVPMIAVGCVARSAALVGVAASWLAFGTPVWLLDVLSGGEIIPTSFLTHLIGPVLAVAAVRVLGWKPWTWLLATFASALLLVVTRLLTAPRDNVNLAFAVWPGWERWFPNHATYLAMLCALATLTFFVVELLAQRLSARSRSAQVVMT
jgi:hypothetical protein